MTTAGIIESPLCYPGGKSRAISKIINCFPRDNIICSPFLGGASIELACVSLKKTVYGYDKCKHLINFWQRLLEDKPRILKIVKSYYPMSYDKFHELKKNYFYCENEFERAAIFYVLNKTSFGGFGITEKTGAHSKDNNDKAYKDHPKSIHWFAVPNNNFIVKHGDFKETLKKHLNDFCYLDPPYCIEGDVLYKRSDNDSDKFDHQALFDILKDKNNWILSYDDVEWVKETYVDFKSVKPTWTYSLSKTRECKEILIFSKDLSDNSKLMQFEYKTQENHTLNFV